MAILPKVFHGSRRRAVQEGREGSTSALPDANVFYRPERYKRNDGINMLDMNMIKIFSSRACVPQNYYSLLYQIMLPFPLPKKFGFLKMHLVEKNS